MVLSFIVFILFSGQVHPLDINKPQADTFLDSLAHKLKLEKWEKDEAPCLESALNVLENVKNHTLWATWMWNANALPSGNLYGSNRHYGSYDQCLKPPWLHTHPQLKTKYCFADFLLSENSDVKKPTVYDPFGSTLDYVDSQTPYYLPLNVIKWGICIPAVCSSTAASKLAKVMYESGTLTTIASDVTVKHCQEAGESPPYSTGFYMFIALILSLVTTAVASTYYRKHVSSEESPNSLKAIITKSFCIVKNREALVKDNKDEIRVMNGIRFLTAVGIVGVHVALYMALSGVNNLTNFEKFLDGIFVSILNFEIIVDTFFTMSGLLHMKGLMGRRQNLFGVLWKRYIRLTGPFALVVFYLIFVSKHWNSGPGWYELEETEICKKYWLRNLLMMNFDFKNNCHIITWYVTCDYHLAILVTFLFYFYQKSRRLGFTVYAAVFILSMIIPGVLTYWFNLQGVILLDFGKYITNYRDTWHFNYVYSSFYSRGSPYIVGVAMGYFMSIYKPADYRKSVSKTWSTIVTALSVCTMIFTFLMVYVTVCRGYDPLEAAVIAGTKRFLWAVAICCIIAICEYGTVPLVYNMLSWSGFTPLSRLSYGIYMIHTLVIQSYQLSQRSTHYADIYGIIFQTVGALGLSIVLSYAMWLFVEAPLINITSHIFFNKSNSIESDKSHGENGARHRNEIHHQNGFARNKEWSNGMHPDREHGGNGVQHQNGFTKTKVM